MQLEDSVKTSTALLTGELPSLTINEWKVMKDLFKILKPWESATTTLSGELYQTASSVLALVEGLSTINTKMLSQKLQPEVLDAALNFKNGLEARLSGLKRSKALCLQHIL